MPKGHRDQLCRVLVEPLLLRVVLFVVDEFRRAGMGSSERMRPLVQKDGGLAVPTAAADQLVALLAGEGFERVLNRGDLFGVAKASQHEIAGGNMRPSRTII